MNENDENENDEKLMFCILHCSQGKSDKVYIVVVRPHVEGFFTNYEVVAYWGRRGSENLQNQVKGSFANMTSAFEKMSQLAEEKIAKGYVNIKEALYNGPVKVDDYSELINVTKVTVGEDEGLEKIGEIEEEPIEEPTVEPVYEKEVKCIDNVGLENFFENGIKYKAELHEDDEFIYVHDSDGRMHECLKVRFSL